VRIHRPTCTSEIRGGHDPETGPSAIRFARRDFRLGAPRTRLRRRHRPFTRSWPARKNIPRQVIRAFPKTQSGDRPRHRSPESNRPPRNSRLGSNSSQKALIAASLPTVGKEKLQWARFSLPKPDCPGSTYRFRRWKTLLAGLEPVLASQTRVGNRQAATEGRVAAVLLVRGRRRVLCDAYVPGCRAGRRARCPGRVSSRAVPIRPGLGPLHTRPPHRRSDGTFQVRPEDRCTSSQSDGVSAPDSGSLLIARRRSSTRDLHRV